MEFNATAKAIIGFLAARPRSGYEIKQLVDHSTRFFWAASYGRIYPELKRLAEAGLIEGEAASQGGRNRTVYELTTKGKRAVREWIAAPPEVFEMRDEGLLKLFFAGVVDAERGPEIARERAARSATVAAELSGLEELIRGQQDEGPAYTTDQGSKTVLRFGIDLNEFIADWFERAAGELGTAKTTTAKKKETIA
jgi:PadR family transcriptional regulator, regulatory protein AphA